MTTHKVLHLTRTSKSFRTQSDLAAAAGVTEVTIRNSNPGIKEKKLPQNNSIARPTAESKSIFK